MRYRYEIDEYNVIRAWDNKNPNENDAPFLYQPYHPDSTPWSSREEAELWIQSILAELPE